MSNKFTRGQLQTEIHAIKQNGLYGKLHDAAASKSISFAHVLGIGSRETNLVNMRGDFRGGIYHGYGVLQGDIQHQFVKDQVKSGHWVYHPEELIDFCLGSIFLPNLARARVLYPKFNDYQHLKIATSLYNASEARVRAGVALGNSDLGTTGHDYAADVLARAAVFNLILAGG